METIPKVYLYQRVVKAKMFIDDNFTEKIDLSLIASNAYFSKYHFFRLFKEMYGKTPLNYLTYLRIEKSKTLLNQKLTIAEISNSIGFESTTSFAALFKKHVNISPSGYRLKLKNEKAEKAINPYKFVPNCFVEQHANKK